MKRNLLYPLVGGLSLIVLTITWLLFSTTQPQIDTRYNPAFDAYLSAYTYGEISRTSSVKIRFADSWISEEEVGQQLSENPFRFYPEIAGSAKWINTRTIAFFPDEALPSGTMFRAKLAVGALISDLPEDLQSFGFQFATKAQKLSVHLVGTEIHEADQRSVKGLVTTQDYVADEKIESLVKARYAGKNLTLSWKHNGDQHHFLAESLSRSQEDQEFFVNWDGKPLGLNDKGELVVTIPAEGQFLSTGTYTYTQPEQHIVVEFSEPLVKNQDLKGLVRLDKKDARYLIQNNQLKIYPEGRLNGPVQLTLSPGIQSETGLSTNSPLVETVEFSQVLPQVRLLGKGTIIPKAEKLPFIFEAKGLRAIDVRAIKIHEKSIPQFLQVNMLDGSDELKRVGSHVMQKRIDLDANKSLNLNNWNRHSLDLAALIDPDPGSIYEIAIGFRRSYAFYACSDSEDSEEDVDMLALEENWHTFVKEEEPEDSYWDYYEEEDDYQNTSDPCLKSYYHSGQIAKRNVLASDLGIIAKAGSGGGLYTVTDLKSAQPKSGVKLEIFDYQHQLISKGQTDAQGMARIQTARPPYLLVASAGNQRGYLRLDDGTALSMSNFDTKGQTYHKGIKGFIYGERGVWRPGDDIFLTFIMEDKDRQLPKDHPVVFELFDSRGQLVEKSVRRAGNDGFYPFPTKTDPDAPTGNYTAKVSVGGASFRKTIKVETVIPNRLKMGLDFDVPYLSAETRDISSTLSVHWLHGAIARGLEAEVKATLVPAYTRFDKYSEYLFQDPVRIFRSESSTLFMGNLDDNGQAAIPAKLSVSRAAPGKLTANFKTRVSEPGGAFSVDRFSMPFHPYNTYVGIKAPKGDAARGMLLTDEAHEIKVVTVDPEGNPTNSSVRMSLHKLSWKWWWDQSKDNVGSYNGVVSGEELQSATIQTQNGRGSWSLQVNYPDWGRYLIRAEDEHGHATGKVIYIDWPGWAGRAMEEGGGGAQMLTFGANKATYKTGEDITLNIPTGGTGRALVSVENGTKVLEAYWVDAKEGSTSFSFKAKPEMAPNVYVHVSLLQPHAQTKNDRPMRLHGVIPVKVEDPQTRLKPVLAMNDVLEPNSKVKIDVSEAKGGPMTYTLAVVDEGLLGLTRYKTPDPWNTFYKREALGVRTWDLYDQVLGAYGGEVKSLLSIGGGGESEAPEGQKTNRFKPVVMYFGPFELKAGETNNHSIQMPNYVGAVRTMVVAGNGKGAYGRAEKSTPVKKPLMVLGTLPRVIGPGESFELPVTVFTTEDHIKEVSLRIQSGKRLSVEGSESQSISFKQAGEQMVNFKLGALSSLGTTSVKIIARSGQEQATYEAEIKVRNPNPPITKVYDKVLEKSQSWSQDYRPIGMRSTNEGYLEVSSIPPINLSKRLQYLIHYPYGCIEQTTSGAFPQVYLTTLLDLNDKQKAEVDKNIRAGINRLKLFQLANGGLSYWPGNGEASEWGTNYAGHFLLEAEKAGYTFPAEMRSKWISYQSQLAQNWNGGNQAAELSQAYRLYLLALAGKAEMGAMNRMRNQSNLEDIAKWQLAAAYHLAGQKKVAKQLTNGLGMGNQNYTELGGTYGSPIRDKAIVLQSLSIMQDRARAIALAKQISERLSSNDWLNTQATAYCLVSMAKYIGKGTNSKMAFQYKIGKGPWESVSVSNPIWQLQLDEVKKTNLQVKNTSGAIIYPRLVLSGIPSKPDTSNSSDGLRVDVIYFDNMDNPISPDALDQGSDFRATVKVFNIGSRDYEEIVLSQIFPSGWEIHNARMDGTDYGSDRAEYVDIRDDRIYTFFDLKQGSSKTFNVMLNASYEGRYYRPAVTAEAMYDRSIHAHRAGGWVEILP